MNARHPREDAGAFYRRPYEPTRADDERPSRIVTEAVEELALRREEQKLRIRSHVSGVTDERRKLSAMTHAQLRLELMA